MNETLAIPWWRLATLFLLLGALVISVLAGRVVEAVVIGALAVPTLLLVIMSFRGTRG